jgi:LmbE family N-acetylglucosaminyl deacetylase
MSKRSTVLVIAAHPDDEVLGCGGSIGRHARQGDDVHVTIMAEGITSRDDIRDRSSRKDELSQLAEAAHRANDLLGVSSLDMQAFPDNRMDTVARLDLIKRVETLIEDHSPDVVYTHHSGDVNVDHRRLHEAVVTACRPMPDRFRVTRVLFFEVSSSTEWQPPGSAPAFVPNWFVDITDSMAAKIDALNAYASEMRTWPHARSVEAVQALAHYRGATIGASAAEAFVLGRQLII